MSDVPGQSGHALPDLHRPVCANKRHVPARVTGLLASEQPDKLITDDAGGTHERYYRFVSEAGDVF